MAREVDFTKLPIGTRPNGSDPIQVCPKCGRNGMVQQSHDGKVQVFYHRATSTEASLPTFPDWCAVVG
jgi:hypothetical protein